jgi:hypothetical protein
VTINTSEQREPDCTADVLEELVAFRDPNVVTMFEIFEDKGWFRNLFSFSANELWLEVQWLDDDHIQLHLVSQRPAAAMPAGWIAKGESKWIIPMGQRENLAAWINKEWLQIRNSEKMKLRMWND